jgi:hypothetical protein
MQRRLTSTLALAAALATAAPRALACPANLFALELSPRLTGARDGLRLFAKDIRGNFRALPLQIDPLDADGHLKFFDEKSSNYFAKPIDGNDLMAFRMDGFGAPLDKHKERLPCEGPVVHEILDRSQVRYAYLTSCGPLAPPAPKPQSVTFDTKGNRLESPLYRYLFNPDNYMQFDSIAFRNAQGGFDEIASDSRLLIRADVRNFFSMQFDSDEIESQLEASRVGAIGNMARVSFFLRILFFKIRMSLSTDVAFYDDSGHIPMQVNIPVNAYDHLHPASGIVYSWALAPRAANAPAQVSMPRLDVPLTRKGYKELAKGGLSFCKSNDCIYSYSVDVGSKRLSMDLRIARDLVERGFYPQFVDDVAAHGADMGWDIDVPKGQRRIGFYFEVSGLPAGGHPWDFWLRLGSPGGGGGPDTCPAPITISQVRR